MDYEIMILQQGDPLYGPVLGGLRADTELLDLMWQAAESRLDEHPDKVWIVAVGPGHRALAWCAYQPYNGGDIEIQCTNSFERPECWDDDLYGIVYQTRHELIRDHSAITYVYNEPLDLHLWDGWTETAAEWSNEPDTPPHHWHELRRTASAKREQLPAENIDPQVRAFLLSHNPTIGMPTNPLPLNAAQIIDKAERRTSRCVGDGRHG